MTRNALLGLLLVTALMGCKSPRRAPATATSGEPTGATQSPTIVPSADSTATPPSGVPMRATRLAVDSIDSQVCAILEDGGVACWGGWRGSDELPHRIPGVAGAVDVSASGGSTIVVTADGKARVFATDDIRAPAVPLPIAGASRVAQHLNEACFIRDGGKVTCVRSVDDPRKRTTLEVRGFDDAVEVGMSFGGGCALTQRKTVVCWRTVGGSTAAPVAGISDAASLLVSMEDACVRSSHDEITCFPIDVSKKTRVALGPGRAVGLYGTFTKGYGAKDVPWACRATDAGIECAGISELGDDGLPDGTMGLIEGTAGMQPRQMVLGSTAGCLIDQAGAVRCWGNNVHDMLGRPAGERVRRARSLPLPKVRAVAAAFDFACGLTEAGEVYCWGPSPKKVANVPTVERIVASNGYACAFAKDGAAWCFDDHFEANRVPALDGLDTIVFPQTEGQPFAAIGRNKELLRGSGSPLERPYLERAKGIGSVSQVGIGPTGSLYAVDVRGKGFRGDAAGEGRLRRAPELDGATSMNVWGEVTSPAKGGPIVSVLGYGRCGWTATKAYGCMDPSGSPFRVRFEGMSAVAAGGDFDCALDAQGAVWCKGENRKGQCGPGPALRESKSPVEVLIPSPQ